MNINLPSLLSTYKEYTEGWLKGSCPSLCIFVGLNLGGLCCSNVILVSSYYQRYFWWFVPCRTTRFNEAGWHAHAKLRNKLADTLDGLEQAHAIDAKKRTFFRPGFIYWRWILPRKGMIIQKPFETSHNWLYLLHHTLFHLLSSLGFYFLFHALLLSAHSINDVTISLISYRPYFVWSIKYPAPLFFSIVLLWLSWW